MCGGKGEGGSIDLWRVLQQLRLKCSTEIQWTKNKGKMLNVQGKWVLRNILFYPESEQSLRKYDGTFMATTPEVDLRVSKLILPIK